ncbi:MAG: sigma 54-interacting transcriptional regulator [Syntrophobacterales bacterium]|jgi:PAS domain S-box-containing protein
MEEQLTLEQIINAASDGVIATDASGYISFVNKEAEKILGFNREKIIGSYIPDILPMTGSLVIKCLETGEPQLGRHILGKSVSLVVNISTIRSDGRVLGTVCNFQGMRQFERAARELESYKCLNKQLDTIFKSSSDGIWVCDGEGTVIKINEASEKLNGIKAQDIISKNVADLVAAGLFDRSVTLEVLETKRQVSIVQYVNKTERHLLVTGTPAFDEEGSIFLVVVNERDMTQLNAFREQLEETRLVKEKFKDELAELSMLELKKQEIIAESEKMRQVLRTALKLAHLGASNILILGESGTGKGLLAKFIHKSSKRKKNPFIQINCPALPESLLEAELFGYEKGAFTGAREQGKVGLFELAQEGTLFLDEIGDLPFSVQAKLLKYLDDHEIMRVGGTKPKIVDCTIIAATNRDLETLTKKRKFRQDLFYRLNTFIIRIPPLRERPEDILELVKYFLRKYNRAYKLRTRISPKALEVLQTHPFSGNVREVQNLLKKAVVMSDNEVLDEFILKTLESGVEKLTRADIQKGHKLNLTEELLTFEKEILENAIARCKSTREVASYLGISQPTVVRKMKKHGLSPISMH